MSREADIRILHVAEVVQAGVGTYLEEVAGFQLREFGAGAVRLVVPQQQIGYLQGLDPAVLRGFPRTGRNPASLWAFGRAVLAEVRAFRPDIVHVHSSFAGAVARPMIRLCSPRPKVVYCAHCWSFLMQTSPWHRRAFTLIERALAPLADRIINLSADEAEQARRHGIPKSRCVVVRNGIAELPLPTLDAEPPFDPAHINLLFVGRFDHQKGFDVLLRAMAAVTDLPLRAYAIGAAVSGTPEPRLPANVEVLGWMSRSEIDRYYQAADAVIMPSRWEGLSFVALEAMRAGAALIASRRSSMPEVVAEGETGWLFDLHDDDDAGDLVRVLRRLDKAGLATMGENAAERFRRHFTADAMNRRLIEVYRELLDARG